MMHPFVKEVLEKTAHLWDEMVYMDSDTDQDITTPDQRKAYESGLLRMREAMIPIARTRLAAAEQRAERLAGAGKAFIEAWEKSHQLEKTDVAYRLMVDALADNEGE